MYKDEVKTISSRCREDSLFLAATISFVIKTIRRRFSEVDANNPSSSVQKEGLEWLSNHIEPLSTVLMSECSLESKMTAVLNIKGINLAKAGFILQLIGEDIGCIDTHNLKKLGINSSMITIDKSRSSVDRSKIWMYIGLCQSNEMGGAEKMWDNWCELIAKKYPKQFSSPEHVSKFHLEKIEDIYEHEKRKRIQALH